ncbi:Eukaryotic translation initiation factor 3 subunit H [Holothuria leucospilota]|uniref:Eukaryotic translation initiation factor 3 subunit H n=1 Tax=Holothuria leucospilota TaxID=206669 RepID=A0A9Q1BW33_HOLLE|nr:Eukaryotic translation initiation factor 3 subunit H [Holothuria leucospilota]
MAAPSTLDIPVARVQIDGLVVLKIIKHCEEEGGSLGELVQGVLLGLVQGDTLEITNCFPFPKNADEDGFDDEQYQMEMMRNLRHVNIDHLHVGWYQSTQYGAFLNKALMESQFNYQNSIEESVVLIYDPVKTSKSTLSLKPYRLTPAAIEAYKEDDFTPDGLKKINLGYENLFEEIPIVVKNSHLINALVCEVEEISPPSGDSFLSLSSGNLLEKNVELLMDQVDDLNQDINKYVNYQRQINKLITAKQQYLYKREQENKARQEKGEPRLPDEDLNKLFKPPTVPPRLDGLLSSGQMKIYCTEINKLASQTFGKLFLADALQSNPSST